ncbi:haloacid dehalogenase-like hydrolase [Yersinia kristensenii]|uniref:haloacid dehalogenase-like hydrolase n=1 Tax=Yersinia kristensenii TaxID=28152 RepID=UPI0005E0D3A2|nr:haloacid dehalogenase-like hydrolase [Yersinia kristensenii]CFR04472.1 haloacid dehalogenase-like hydrolase [Yersinia kristensenii]
MNKGKKIAIVDVCHTLYKENTTIGFINYANNNSLYLKLLRFSFVKNLLILLGKALRKDLYRILYIRTLAGKSKYDLYTLALHYYDDVLKYTEISEVHDLIIKNKDIYNYRLCSASLDIIIGAVVERNVLFDKEYISSKLGYDKSEVCTGKLICDLLGNKAREFDSPDWVITDNVSDLDLIRKSKRSTVISRQKNIKFWTKNSIDVDIVI